MPGHIRMMALQFREQLLQRTAGVAAGAEQQDLSGALQTPGDGFVKSFPHGLALGAEIIVYRAQVPTIALRVKGSDPFRQGPKRLSFVDAGFALVDHDEHQA